MNTLAWRVNKGTALLEVRICSESDKTGGSLAQMVYGYTFTPHWSTEGLDSIGCGRLRASRPNSQTLNRRPFCPLLRPFSRPLWGYFWPWGRTSCTGWATCCHRLPHTYSADCLRTSDPCWGRIVHFYSLLWNQRWLFFLFSEWDKGQHREQRSLCFVQPFQTQIFKCDIFTACSCWLTE